MSIAGKLVHIQSLAPCMLSLHNHYNIFHWFVWLQVSYNAQAMSFPNLTCIIADREDKQPDYKQSNLPVKQGEGVPSPLSVEKLGC